MKLRITVPIESQVTIDVEVPDLNKDLDGFEELSWVLGDWVVSSFSEGYFNTRKLLREKPLDVINVIRYESGKDEPLHSSIVLDWIE